MLTYNDLRAGTIFILDNEPYEVLEFEFLRMQQRKPVAKTKVKNLVNGKVLEKTFHYGDTFEEAAIEKQAVKFLYHHRGEYWFSAPDDPKNRFTLKEEIIGAPAQFLKANTEAAAIRFNNAIIGMDVPIKIDLAVKDAPPSIRGNTAQGGTKSVTLETGATINAPLFVNAGDVIRVNTQTGEYVERVEKTKG